MNNFYSMMLQMMNPTDKAEGSPDSGFMMQALSALLPPESRDLFNRAQELAELQQMMAGHRGSGWPGQHNMLHRIRPRVSEEMQAKVDVLIKFAEIGILMESRRGAE